MSIDPLAKQGKHQKPQSAPFPLSIMDPVPCRPASYIPSCYSFSMTIAALGEKLQISLLIRAINWPRLTSRSWQDFALASRIRSYLPPAAHQSLVSLPYIPLYTLLWSCRPRLNAAIAQLLPLTSTINHGRSAAPGRGPLHALGT
jgi:hypothetical protein